MNIVTVIGVTKREEKKISNSLMKLDLSGTRRVTTDARQKLTIYMINYMNYTSDKSQKNASHSASTSLTHRSMKV